MIMAPFFCFNILIYKGLTRFRIGRTQLDIRRNVTKEHAGYIKTFGYTARIIMLDAGDCWLSWRILCLLPDFIVFWWLQVYLAWTWSPILRNMWYVNCFLKSYSVHDLLDSYWKLLLISLIKITKFFYLMQLAFWLTTAGIIIGGIIAFFLMYSYLRARKIF